jgi:hypothetical protein
LFDVTVNDATGSNTTAGIAISNARDQGKTTIDAVTTFETEIVSDGVTPVVLVWDVTTSPASYDTFFVMNGFEISDGQTEDPRQPDSNLRRPISPQQPMWLVHIDTWNYADPQKIIDLIPQTFGRMW